MKIRDHRYFLAFAFLLVFFCQGLYLIQATSPTVDEVAFHSVNGYVFLKTHDYRMSPANPPLIREWMALPWLAIHPKLNLNKESWREADSVSFSFDFFYKDNRPIADILLYSSRFMILLLGTALGFLIFMWSKSLYGMWGGIVSLALYTLCPSFLAHSALGTIDVGGAFFFTLSAFFLHRYLDEKKSGGLFVLAFSMGLMFAAKTNTLFFGPIFLSLIFFRKGFSGLLRAGIVFLIVPFFVVWACHFFEYKTLLGGGVPRIEEKLGFIAAISRVLFPGNAAFESFFKNAALHLPIPMPTYFLGIAGIIRHHTAPFYHFAFGKITADQPWWSYPFFFFAKMTIPFLILLGLRAITFFGDRSSSWKEDIVIIFPALSYLAVMCFEKTGNGSRYLFPAICLLFVWVGGVAQFKTQAYSKTRASFIALLLAANLFSVFITSPNYLSYFNAFVGGSSQGYRYTRDSDVDWGQGLKALQAYMKKNNIPTLKLVYFGSADPSFYNIHFENLTPAEQKAPAEQIYAISLFCLEGLEWARNKKPTAVVGGSIFIYDFRVAAKGGIQVP